MDAPPPPEIRRVDFSQFHPLDHRIWACRWYPGGRIRHLQYLWQFKWDGNVHRNVHCRLGHHRGGWAWRRSGPNAKAFYACADCWKDLDPPRRDEQSR